MKKTKIMSILLSFVMLVGLCPGSLLISAADDEGAVEPAHLSYIAPDSAYVNLYGNLDSRNASFIDGISMGITDTKHENYYELVKEDGLEARKQYNANSTYIKVDPGFFEAGDELLVSIEYYDYGPSEGTYYLEYYKTTGGTYQEKLIKPGRHPGWSVKTVVTSELAPHGYANGSTFRIQNGAFNTFRKVEIVNLSKQRREKIVPQIKTLHYEPIRTLEKMEILKLDDPMFSQANLANPVSVYDVNSYINKYSMTDTPLSVADKEKTLTQAELLKKFMKITGTDYAGQESIVDFAYEIGLIKTSSYFVFDDAPATYYNLVGLLYDIFEYEISPDNPYILQLYDKGFFGNKTIAQINNDTLARVYYMGSKKNPYYAITDNHTGRTFFYINFYGSDLMRPYFSEQQWTLDGKRFLVGTASGLIYLYDVRTQMMHYIGQSSSPSTNDSDGIVGGDGMIYWYSTYNGYKTFMRCDPDDPNLESKVVYTFPRGVSSGTDYIARDGSYFGGEVSDPYNELGVAPEGHSKVVVFYLKEGNVPGVPDYNYKINYYKFPDTERGGLNHRQANPVYPDLVFFVHEANIAGGYEYYQMYDRCNVMNMETGEVIHFNVGKFGRGAIQQLQHESWSPDGEYLYFVCGGVAGSQGKAGFYFGRGNIVRVDKDMTHRQYYNFPNADPASVNHCFPSWNNDFIAGDANWVGVGSLKTNQYFNVTNVGWQMPPGVKHPYHAHAQVAWGDNNYMLSWGHVHKGVLGVAWYDFTEIVENEIPDGGRFKLNDYVECVSYETLDCETDEVVKDGKTARRIKAGRELYLDVNTEIVDTTDDAVKVTFDYLDNGREPIKLTYTRGVKMETMDIINIYNAKKTISRRGTNKWKTATITIDSANMESIGEYESDFKISGGGKTTYIANIKVEKVEK